MNKCICFLLFAFLSVTAIAQIASKSEDDLKKYPTYRVLKAPIDSVYKMTLENPGQIVFDFDKFKYLQKLCLFGNDWDYDLFNLPGYFFSFENLTHLTIANTDIPSLGTGIKKFENLQSLSVANNNLVSLPAEMSKLQDLRELVIDNNIKEIPDLLALENLTIYFETNIDADSGSIPKNISGLAKLKVLTLNAELTQINISEMIAIIKTLPVLEELSFIDPNLEENDIKSLTGIKKLKELNLPSIEVSPEVFAGFSFLKKLSFGKYLQSDPVIRGKFWETILSFTNLEEITTTFAICDTQYYRRLKKLNLVLNFDGGLTEQFAALKDMPSLWKIEMPRSSTIPRNMSDLKTLHEIDITELYGIDASIIFGYLMMIPTLEKIIVSNDQFTVFPPEALKMVHIKEMEIHNIQHGTFVPISEKEKARGLKMMPNCTFNYIEMF